MKIITIVNQKGGVGKTTTTLSLGAALAEQGQRVLIVDLDPQRNATSSLFGGDYAGLSINDLIYFAVRGLPIHMEDYIRYSEKEHVDYIPSVPDLASAPSILATNRDSNTVLSRIFHAPYFETRYDYILIDDKPSLDLLVVNSLVASDQLIVPVQPEDYALDGIADLWSTIDRIRDAFNAELDLNGILISRANLSRKETKKNMELLRETFGSLVYETIVPDWADVSHAQEKGVTVLQLKGSKLGDRFRALTQEVTDR